MPRLNMSHHYLVHRVAHRVRDGVEEAVEMLESHDKEPLAVNCLTAV